MSGRHGLTRHLTRFNQIPVNHGLRGRRGKDKEISKKVENVTVAVQPTWHDCMMPYTVRGCGVCGCGCVVLVIRLWILVMPNGRTPFRPTLPLPSALPALLKVDANSWLSNAASFAGSLLAICPKTAASCRPPHPVNMVYLQSTIMTAGPSYLETGGTSYLAIVDPLYCHSRPIVPYNCSTWQHLARRAIPELYCEECHLSRKIMPHIMGRWGVEKKGVEREQRVLY